MQAVGILMEKHMIYPERYKLKPTAVVHFKQENKAFFRKLSLLS